MPLAAQETVRRTMSTVTVVFCVAHPIHAGAGLTPRTGINGFAYAGSGNADSCRADALNEFSPLAARKISERHGTLTKGRNHCKYELAINPKTAKMLGLDVPPTSFCAIRSRATAAGGAEVPAGGSSVPPRRIRQL